MFWKKNPLSPLFYTSSQNLFLVCSINFLSNPPVFSVSKLFMVHATITRMNACVPCWSRRPLPPPLPIIIIIHGRLFLLHCYLEFDAAREEANKTTTMQITNIVYVVVSGVENNNNYYLVSYDSIIVANQWLNVYEFVYIARKHIPYINKRCVLFVWGF